MKQLNVRLERPEDIDAITALTVAAFTGHPHSKNTEHKIIHELRTAGALTLSLVAEEKGGGIVGHVAFSPVRIEGDNAAWFGLGPISVAPEKQRGGIGSLLMRRGLDEMRRRGAAGIVLVGDPHFYERFGFRQSEKLSLPGVPAEYFLALSWTAETPPGVVSFHQAFSAA